MNKYGHYIAGRYEDPSAGEWLDSVDPYRGTVWAKVARGNDADVDRAVSTASRALHEGPWSRCPRRTAAS